MRPRQESHAERSPGCFNANGSWNPNGTPAAYMKVHASVMGLVQTRRNHPDLLPAEFHSMILSHGIQNAFPMLHQWAGCQNWLAAPATSTAELMVRNAGGPQVPNPIGVIPPLTPEIAAVIESVTHAAVPSA